MSIAIKIALLLVFAPIAGLTILCGAMVAILFILKKKSPSVSPDDQAEEAAMIQKMFRSLSRMEKRIESLETLLHEPEEDASKTHPHQEEKDHAN